MGTRRIVVHLRQPVHQDERRQVTACGLPVTMRRHSAATLVAVNCTACLAGPELVPAPSSSSAPVAHVTVVTRRASRRIMGAVGERRQLCGAAATHHDVLYRDARRGVRPLAPWVLCPACEQQLGGQALEQPAPAAASSSSARQLTCGCCTGGCVCWNHHDATRGVPVATCAAHEAGR